MLSAGSDESLEIYCKHLLLSARPQHTCLLPTTHSKEIKNLRLEPPNHEEQAISVDFIRRDKNSSFTSLCSHVLSEK